MKYLLKNNDRKEYISIDRKDIFQQLNRELNETKSLIDAYPKEWEIVKKQIHDHEYIYTSSYHVKNISQISPISRSYFKFREMYYEYNLLKTNHKNKIACLAEAPGGFIESIIHLLPNDNIQQISSITLLSSDKKVPRWNHSLKKYSKIKFHAGIKGNGDLYDFKNIISLIKEIGKNTVHLVTGDGGFDYSSDYSKQEENSFKLIYSEVFLALNLQIKGGIFICKIFDTFLPQTIILIHILQESYDEIYIHKPKISRYSNSEKYLVCRGYKGYNKEIITLLCHHFEDNKIDIPISKSMMNDIVKFNRLYCEKQIDHIKTGINLIKDNKLNYKPTSEQINAAIQWCKKYDITINNSCVFLKNNFK